MVQRTHPVYKANDPVGASGASFADMNGNGVDDLVLFGNNAAVAIDFQSGARPGLLTKINHASGATTTFAYERLIDQERRSGDRWTTELGPWTSHSPVPIHVVTNVTTSSGAPSPNNFSTSVAYTYRDPVFDRWRGRLAGFRRTRVTHGAIDTETEYEFGACFPKDEANVDPAACPSPEADNDLVRAGLPFVVEQRSRSSGAFVSTTVYSYVVNPGGGGLERVNMVHAAEVNTWIYDLANYSPQSLVIPMLVSKSGQENPVMQDVPIRAAGVHLRSRQYIDENWRQLFAWDDGQIEFSGTTPIDRPIKTTTTWHAQGQFSERVDRPESVTVAYDGLGAQTPLIPDDNLIRRIRYVYDSAGRVTRGWTDIAGALPLERFHASGASVAPEPTSSNGPNATLFTVQYNAYGLPTTTRGAVSECVVREYSPTYLDSLQAVYESKDGNCSTSVARLRTGYTYDRGLGVITSISTPSGSESKYEFDRVGRLVRVLETPGAGGAASPTLQLTHFDITAYTDAFSRVHKTKIARLDEGGAEASVVWQHTSSLGTPLITFKQADTSAGDGADWIAQPGPILQDDTGVPVQTFRPSFHTGAPTYFYASDPAAEREIIYDLLARPTVVRRSSDWTVVDQRIYRPLSFDVMDAETSTQNANSHAGQYVTIDHDGHGRTVRTTKRVSTSTPIETRFDHLPTGQVTAIQRNLTDALGTPRSVLRWFRYDSLGRVVENAEPNTTKDFSPNPADAGSMKAWRYAYDRSGRLVGTRDARGCGKNLQYDPAGRLLAEDYSPCLATHSPHSMPDFATGVGTEVFYRYDDAEAGQATDCGSNPLCMQGRLVSVRDRGAHTRFAYDAKGRQTAVERRIARPGTPRTDPAQRYAEHWFRTTTEYDFLNRPTATTTGAESAELLDANDASAVTFDYSARGVLKEIGGSYGTLASQFVLDADGFEREVTYGGGTATVRRTPDSSRHLRRHEVFRAPQAIWSDDNYHAPDDPNELMMAHQLVLADTTFDRDLVGNVTAALDARDPGTWVDGSKPRSTTMTYDDEYRIATVNYGDSDQQVSPFAPEEMWDPRPLPRATYPWRIGQQAFRHDGYGNLVEGSQGDSLAFDRALGYTTHGYAISKPGQLLSADADSPVSGFDAYYDDAGNLAGFDLERVGPCSAPTYQCSQRFLYDWDEVGQLVRARRWNFDTLTGKPVYPVEPAETPAAEIGYSYGQGERVIRFARDLYTIDIFGSLRLKDTTFDASSSTYAQDADKEHVFAGRVAHVLFNPSMPHDLPNSERRVLFTLGDHLGSASVVVDKDTGELVERVTYQAYGAVDSDYRSLRWEAFREDLRFTGKEDEIELGLQYFGARYYSPHLGRFISPDPLTIHAAQGDINPYAYVRGRVYNMVDPLGLFGQGCLGNEDCGGGGGAGGPDGGDLVDSLGRLLGGGGGGGGGGGNGKPSGPQTGPRGFDPYPQLPTLIPTYAMNALSAVGGTWYSPIHIPGTERAHFSMSGVATAGRNHAVRHAFKAIDPIHAPGAIENLTGVDPLSPLMSTVSKDPNDYSNAVATGVELLSSFGGGFVAGGEAAVEGAGARTAGSGGPDIQLATVLREIRKGEKIADLVSEVRSLREATNLEYAVVSRTNGTRALVYGGSEGIDFAEFPLRRILGHSHPLGYPQPSGADFELLQSLGQRSSWLLEENLTRFGWRRVQ